MLAAAGVPLVMIAVVAFAVRAAYVIVQTKLGLFDIHFEGGDVRLYLELAESIADGRGMSLRTGEPTAYVGPGYPLFLALALKVGADALAVGLIQSAIGAATAVLAGVAAAELARAADMPERERRLAPPIAALGVAFYPHLVFWTGYVITETLFVFLVAAAIVATLRAMRLRSTTWALAAGSLSASAALTRPAYLGVALALVCFWLLMSRNSVRRLVLPALMLVGLAVPMGAWTIRNVVQLGTPIVTVTEAGFVFYQGNSRGSSGGSRGYVDAKDFSPLNLPEGISEVERDRVYLERALGDIRDDPWATVRRWPAKVWNMWRPTYEGASLRNEAVTLATYPPVLTLGALGAAWLARRHMIGLVPGVILGCWFAIHMLVTGMIRFRLPAELVLLICVPFGLLAILSAWRHDPSIARE